MAESSRRAALVSLSLAAFSAASAQGEEDPTLLTGKSPNGRCWKKLNDSIQLLFLYGVKDGVSAFSSALEDLGGDVGGKPYKAALEIFSASNVTVEDLQKEISRLYEEPANTAIPIVYLYGLGIAIFKGMPSEVFQQRLATMRKMFSST